VTRIRIRNGRVVDPTRRDETVDLVIADGRVDGYIAATEGGTYDREIDAAGMIVAPGFVDLHCHLREPGFEDKETVATGVMAAVAGGFTTVCAMPNTNPTLDTAADIEFVLAAGRRAGKARVIPLGTVTRGEAGKELSDTAEMAAAGAVAFSDDGKPVWDARIMRYALAESLRHGKPIVNHCEDPQIADGGVMNEGAISDLLGLKGIPRAAEDVMVARDIELARHTGGRLHLAHISTEGSVRLLRNAKRDGIAITAEVTPHHLTLTEDWVVAPRTNGRNGDSGSSRGAPALRYDTRAKVNPPLRREEDRQALIAALSEGLIDVIATDHAPHRSIDKDCTFDEAAFGITGLETALGALLQLVESGQLTLPDMIRRLTLDPCRAFGLPYGSLAVGAPADVVIFDPEASWTVDSARLYSKGKNTPLDGHTLHGQVLMTLVGGTVAFEREQG
jgi:dihydroorotase